MAITQALGSFHWMATFRDLAFDLLIKDYRSKAANHAEEMQARRDELARLEKRDRNLIDMRAAGEVDKAEYAVYHEDYKRRIEALKGSIVYPLEPWRVSVKRLGPLEDRWYSAVPS